VKLRMSHKERVLASFNFEEPDRIPIDIAFRSEPWTKLKSYLGTDDDEKVFRWCGGDFRVIGMNPPEGWRPTLHPDGTFEDEWGIRRKIGSTGLYEHFHYYHPLADAEDLSNYEFPDPSDSTRWQTANEIMKKYGEEYAMLGANATTLFEISWQLRGFKKFLRDLYINSKFANQLLDKLTDIRIEMGLIMIEIGVDIMFLGDDVGMQTGMLLPPHIWKKHFKPRMQKIIYAYRSKKSDIIIDYHSDGDITAIVPDLIEIGVNVLNPVQPDCMDPVKIKNEYGDRLAIRGAISVQETMPFGSPEEVKSVVIERIKTLAPGGGFAIAPSHVIPPETPVENIVTLYKTAQKYGFYPMRS